MLKEEAQHLTRGVRAFAVRPGDIRIAARPGVTGSVYEPLFHNRRFAVFLVNRAGVAVAAGYLPSMNRYFGLRALLLLSAYLHPLADNAVAVAGINHRVLIAVEDDGWHHAHFRCIARRAG